ncbi:PadR family transcriptional regulator [Deinococcus psychrotolerans]|uniref:PadR family transcriptional regulator n=1 Tax=Deinococcus psychrotolerans TaxID=2489213 RepID=A0A3G8YD59_9DEIO|nr:PadR family transcriptional regulator [Deinococcus psychrotolerans]AZI42915.1 PadR family transcriptional regulator [Deinococcus psychrotolerans]
MSDASQALGPSAYIVLGLLSQCGSGTSYDLKRWADESVGHFWNFPRSQLYAEPQRLVSLGLLNDTQEDGGRRKRTYQVTPAGRAALQDWLSEPAGFPELRDLGLLKLFFAEEGSPQQVRQLAAEQLQVHRERLAVYQALSRLPDLSAAGPSAFGRHTLRMGFLYQEANITFWTELLDSFSVPPLLVPEPPMSK